MQLNNPVEKLVYRAITWTWCFYALGALYLVGPVLGWCMAAIAVLALYLDTAMRADLRPTGWIPALVWLWIFGMIAMLITLVIGHVSWGLGLTGTIKSVIGWAKGWALLPLFLLAGAVLPISRDVIIRGQCVVGLWTLILVPLLFIAPMIGLPEKIYTSPLKAVGGPGPEYFSVYFYTLDPASWTPRWQFFAPWSPFAGLLGVLMVAFSLEEKNRRWMITGVLAGLVMIILSKSRMSIVAVVVCTIVPRLMPLIARSLGWQLAAIASASMAVLGTMALQFAMDAVSIFKSARADSTRVRETLQRIAYERWQADAFWFGHGTVQPGPHLVEYMPIGSHHTWYGLLFVKGIVGFLALAIPMAVHAMVTAYDAIFNPRGRLPMAIMLVFGILTFGENIEIQTYLIWPAILMLGIHIREMCR